MKKRILSMLLVIAMVLCMVPTVFAANSGTCGIGLSWTLDKQGTMTISGNGAMEDYFPGFSPWYDYCAQIKTVIIESGVTTVGNNAFTDCSKLTSVTIPDGVTSIGNNAFYNCASLTSIEFPDSLTTIGDSAFSGCASLAAINVDSGNATYKSVDGVLFDKAGTTLKQCPVGKSGTYTIPDGVTSIGNYAFTDCKNLTSVTIPDGVTSIGYSAFDGCDNLTEITFQGDAPSFESNNVFSGVNATAYYPTANSTWTLFVLMQNYGGTITWEEAGVPVSLEIVSLPKVNYCLDEELDSTNLRVSANYSNGGHGVISTDNLTVGQCDMSTTGKKTVTVSYEELLVSFNVFVHEGYTTVELDKASYPESKHLPYDLDTDETQIVSCAGAKELVLVFSQDTSVESDWDWIYVYDGNNNQITKYTGAAAAGDTVTVPGDTAKICLSSDFMGNNYYGYSFDSISAKVVAHPEQSIAGKAATCTEDGLTDGVKCSICDEILTEQETIPATGHTEEVISAKDATCTEAGLTEGVKCSVCEEILTEQATIPATGHTEEVISGEDATCTEAGLTDGVKCSICDEILTEQATIPANGHSWSEWEVYTEATYEAPGEERRTCSNCDEYESRATAMLSGWALQDNIWYYYKDGSAQTGWQYVDGIWYYFGTNGAMQTGWLQVEGTWYYLSSGGAMQTGWQQIGGAWYYFNTSGAMQTGWLKPGNSWYYLTSSGAMATGWVNDGGTWYYMNSSGAMQTGWQQIDGTWYYFSSSGAMQTGWHYIGGKCYYFTPGGAMVTGNYTVDGIKYTFSSSGVWLG